MGPFELLDLIGLDAVSYTHLFTVDYTQTAYCHC